MEIEDERVQSTVTAFLVDGVPYEIHYYSRYISDETEFWLFGCGLGDQTTIYQLGGAFLDYIDEFGDPGLGKIMMSLGHGASTFYPYRGDFNIVWGWAIHPHEVKDYLNKFQSVKPTLFLNPYKKVCESAESLGIHSLKFCSGVGHNFKPLGLERDGFGYTGLDNKGQSQKDIVLSPAISRGNFEWINKEANLTAYLTIDGLNEWYNRKKIVFGMIPEDRQGVPFLPTRFFETLGSGSPFITYKLNGLDEHYGMEYPYQTTSRGHTEFLMDLILDDYDQSLENMKVYSEYTHENHSYVKRIGSIFDKLKEMS